MDPIARIFWTYNAVVGPPESARIVGRTDPHQIPCMVCPGKAEDCVNYAAERAESPPAYG